ncbi:hypothetical protein BWI93_07320 [Siphonobacter sp. BAB-5385]|nr:hypothetical protein BWI93_07320 [Siphonobacter sp. BAB-5385]
MTVHGRKEIVGGWKLITRDEKKSSEPGNSGGNQGLIKGKPNEYQFSNLIYYPMSTLACRKILTTPANGFLGKPRKRAHTVLPVTFSDRRWTRFVYYTQTIFFSKIILMQNIKGTKSGTYIILSSPESVKFGSTSQKAISAKNSTGVMNQKIE